MTTKIVVVDDHVLLREAIVALIESEPGLEVVGTASTAAEGGELVDSTDPDVVLLDLSLPGGGALDLAARIHGKCKVVVVSMHERPEYVRAAFAANVSGYVFKGSTHQHLIDAIHHVVAGGRYVDVRVADAVHDDPDIKTSTVTLSDRERVVLVALAHGKAYKEISAELDIGVRTIETYRRRIVEKLGLRTRADFFRYAVELGLVSPGGDPVK